MVRCWRLWDPRADRAARLAALGVTTGLASLPAKPTLCDRTITEHAVAVWHLDLDWYDFTERRRQMRAAIAWVSR